MKWCDRRRRTRRIDRRVSGPATVLGPRMWVRIREMVQRASVSMWNGVSVWPLLGLRGSLRSLDMVHVVGNEWSVMSRSKCQPVVSNDSLWRSVRTAMDTRQG